MALTFKPVIPGGYGEVVVKPSNLGVGLGRFAALAAPGAGGEFYRPYTFSSTTDARRVIGDHSTLNYINTLLSNGAPAVVYVRIGGTITFDGVYFYDDTANSYTDLTNTVNKQYGTSSFTLDEANDAVYFGADSKFESIEILFTSVPSSNVSLVYEYWDGAGWTTIPNVTDGTGVGGYNWKQSGLIKWNKDDILNWTANSPGTGLPYLYWVRARVTSVGGSTGNHEVSLVAVNLGALNAQSVVDSGFQSVVSIDSSGTPSVITSAATNFTASVDFDPAALTSIMFGFPEQFSSLSFDYTNGDRKVDLEYWDGTAWQPIQTNIDLSTGNSKDITWTPSALTGWIKDSFANASGSSSTSEPSAYWVRLVPQSSGTTDPTFKGGVIYRNTAGNADLLLIEALDAGTMGNSIKWRFYEEDGVRKFEVVRDLSSSFVQETYEITDLSDLQSKLSDSVLVSVSDVSGLGILPKNDANWKYLSGGSNGTTRSIDYQMGLDAILDNEDVGVVVLLDGGQDAVNALNGHIIQAASLSYQKPRMGVAFLDESIEVGNVFGSASIDSYISAAGSGTDGRVLFVIQRATIADIVNGGTIKSRAALACAVAGLLVSKEPADPITWDTVNISAIDRRFSRTEIRELIKKGVLVVSESDRGFKVERGVTTDTSSVFFESSVRRAIDATDLQIRNSIVNKYVGKPANRGVLASIEATVSSWLDSLIQPAENGGTISDWRNLSVSFNTDDPTRVDITYEILPIYPINFVFTTLYVESGVSFDIGG